MLSKNPIELPVGRKLTKEELAQALRLSVIAELDAINLYLQLASCTEDQTAKKVFEDIAKEEKTHVGEFLALLKSLDQEQVHELAAGAEEVAKLTGVSVDDPPSGQADEWSHLRVEIKKYADSLKKLRDYLPITHIGRGVDAVPVEEVSSDLKPVRRYVIQLKEISQVFAISQASLDHAKVSGQLDTSPALVAVTNLSLEEEKAFLSMIKEVAGRVEKISSWDDPGSALSEVATALSKMVAEGFPKPYVLFVSPSRYAKLIAVHERTGVMELQRLKALVSDVVAVPTLADGEALLISSNPQVLDLVVGADTELDYIGPEDGLHLFRLWETVAARVRCPGGISLLKQ
ncbi:MAG: encapsulin [Candidatus Korarchaeum sp.]|nr:encapsulin [Candidatus Korarchaeum sp.]MDW8036299.1 family 1 encapsulin nanocompartment shell protein [Candidatus Korarchaeum sp.]